MKNVIEDFLKSIRFEIAEGADYQWNSYGPRAYMLDSFNQDQLGQYAFGIIIDKMTQTVYEMTAFDWKTETAYRWINPDYIEAYKNESTERGFPWDEAGQRDDGTPMTFQEITHSFEMTDKVNDIYNKYHNVQ